MTMMPAESFKWLDYVIVEDEEPPPPPPDPTFAEFAADPTIVDPTYLPPDVWLRLGDGGTSGARTGTAQDATANNRDGTYQGSVTGAPGLTTDDSDTACALSSGSASYVAIADDAWMDTPSITVSQVFQLTAAVDATNGDALISRYTGGGGFNWLLWRTTANKWGVQARNTGGTAYNANSSGNADLNPHIAHFKWVAGVALTLFIDGVQVATVAVSGNLQTGSSPIEVGRYSGSANTTPSGVFDETRIWLTGLSDAQIADDAAAFLGTFDWPDPEPEPDPEPVYGWVTNEDRTAGLVSIATTYGARDAATPPLPMTVEVELAEQVAGDCPQVGTFFRLALTDAAATALGLVDDEPALFTGEVTDPTIDPTRRVHTIGGAGRLGRANRRTLISRDWPVEDDGARTTRILTAAAMDLGTIDAGTVDLASPGQDDTAGALLDQVTDSTGGSVLEQPDGLIDYHDTNHRRGGAVVLTLTTGQLLRAITWQQHVDDLINEVEVSWGGGDLEGGTVKVREPGSITTHNGVYPARRSTALTTASDAHSLGQLVVARRSEPRWQLPDLEIDLMHMVDDTLRGSLLKLRHGDRILITGVPGPYPYTGDVEFLVEGWRQQIGRPAQGLPWRWRMILSVSDPALSGVSIRWMDFEVGYAWEDLPVGLSWLDLALIDDPADL